MKMRTIPRLMTPSIHRMWVFLAAVRWITARWFGCMGCRRRYRASSCARNISRMPKTNTEDATIHAFRKSLLHPDIATAAAVSSDIQSSKDESGRTERGSMSLPLKRESWVTLWGTISGEQGRGFGSTMVVLMIFFIGRKFWLCQSITERREKIWLDLKKVNASWSLFLYWPEPWTIFCPPFGGKMIPIVFLHCFSSYQVYVRT